MTRRCPIKWHKKMCDHLDDPFIQELLYEFKSDGYLVYFGTIALICKENKYDKLDGKATFRGRFLKEKFHVSVTKLQQIFDFCQTKGKLSFNFHEKNFDFDFPKILEIKDSHSKGFQVISKSLPPKKKKEEVDVEVDKKTCHRNNGTPVEKYKFEDWDMDLAKDIFEHTQRLVPSTKEPNWKNWANEIRLMRVRDKRSKGDIHTISCFMAQDAFWSEQIRSPHKLRKHYETLYAKRNSGR